ncbi:MAG: metal-dependent hydrolase [Theionarchaea archaeon]|nr:metal-dependent hydrolase [Theionarchaea archaeon]MBU7037994.1 metal-dependent hydrolase [Theionarchaea archaeon]
MDLISHGLVGIVIGRGLNLDKKSWVLFVAACMLPDFDGVSILGGIDAVFQYHRGVTHSIVGVIVGALVLGLLYLVMTVQLSNFQKNKVLLMLCLFMIGAFGHLFLDLLTPWSMAIRWPFSDSRTVFDITSFFDPVFFAIFLLAAVVGHYRKDRKTVKVLAVVSLCLVATFFGIRYYEKGVALATVQKEAGEEGYGLPTALPHIWSVVVQREDEKARIYYIYTVNTLSQSILETRTVETLPLLDTVSDPPVDTPEKAVSYSRKDEKIQAFLAKARLPAVVVTQVGEENWQVLWYDAFMGNETRHSGITALIGEDGTITVHYAFSPDSE